MIIKLVLPLTFFLSYTVKRCSLNYQQKIENKNFANSLSKVNNNLLYMPFAISICPFMYIYKCVCCAHLYMYLLLTNKWEPYIYMTM